MANQFNVGSIVEGKISQIIPFGAFVHLDATTAIPFEKKEDTKKQEFHKTTEELSPSIDLFSSNKGNGHLEDLLKEFTRQSNERHADINKRLKR